MKGALRGAFSIADRAGVAIEPDGGQRGQRASSRATVAWVDPG